MPALDWVNRAKRQANKSTDFRQLGSMNATVCFESGRYACKVIFSGFKVGTVSEISSDEVKDQEIVISMPTRQWNSYLYNRRMKRAPNLLHLDAEKKVIKTKNIAARLAFERILNSLQAFVDYGATNRS